ncbi:MAG: DegT/DnrJ/EryC1/StrS family aminotransferase [Alcanivoracaceae bacterium]|nr:DegT/DnrJ/EryC1/StrS family aminotransferase [Alcanivoracaceae bacterium]
MKSYPLAKPEINNDDIEAVTKVLKSPYLSRGPMVMAFEKQFAKEIRVKYACALSSGTAGLIIALQALGVKTGDEVITVSFTVPATVNSIVAIGAIPIMVDIDLMTLGMCPNALKQAISKKTKAIIVVHAFGKAAQIDKLITIARENNITVIEDACEAIGNDYKGKPLGSLADIGVFAFYPNKQITTGEGGMLVTNDEVLHHQFELLRNHGRSMNGDLFDQISFGWNFRMSDINAALGLSQLNRIKQIVTRRQEIAADYHAILSQKNNISCPAFSVKEHNSAWFVYVIRLLNGDRDKLLFELQHLKIQCGRYFAPVHMQPYYRDKYPGLQLKNTELIANQCLALPFYPQLNKKDIVYICDKLVKSSQYVYFLLK